MDNLHMAIRALEDHYREYGQGRGLEYTYGFMDALAVLRGGRNCDCPIYWTPKLA